MLVAALHAALRAPDVVPTMGAAGSATAATTEPSQGETEQHALFAETPAAYAAGRFGRVLGQVQDTFIVATSDDEVFFLDQHVVHERVLFERLETELAAGAPPSQVLLFPETVDLPPAARALLERWRPTLERLGFAFEPRPGGALAVSAVPALLQGRRAAPPCWKPRWTSWAGRRPTRRRWSARSRSWRAAARSRPTRRWRARDGASRRRPRPDAHAVLSARTAGRS